MRCVIQRVSSASVTVAGESVGAIGQGLLILIGVGQDDTDKDARVVGRKVANLRIFEREGKMDLSVGDVGGGVLVVSQFTLLGATKRGRRPSFTDAAPPDQAEPLIDLVATTIRDCGVPVETGRFGAFMSVSLVNDGPVTLVIDTVDGAVAG